MEDNEAGYLALMKRILKHGEVRKGRNGNTYSVFGEKLTFDLQAGFPLLTTKRVFWRGVVEELLWFLRGSTNAKELADKGVHIWDGNTSRTFLDSVGLHDVPEGNIGAGYGYQWRCFGGNYPSNKNGVDQLRYILGELKDNPHGRRALLSAWNPQQLHRMALPPCHYSYLFYVGEKGLSCMMNMRSCDVGAGLPFNIASTALFTSILAHILGLSTDRVIICTGDTHIYEDHIESAMEQVTRVPYTSPTLTIRRPPPETKSVDDMIAWIETLTADHIVLENYQHHPALKYAMIV